MPIFILMSAFKPFTCISISQLAIAALSVVRLTNPSWFVYVPRHDANFTFTWLKKRFNNYLHDDVNAADKTVSPPHQRQLKQKQKFNRLKKL